MIFLFFALIQSVTPEPLINKWSLFFYIDGDNNLDGSLQNYVNDILNLVDSLAPYPFNIAIQQDRRDTNAWTKRYYIFGDTIIEENYAPETNMGDGQELVNFVQDAITEMGITDHYALIMMDHGGGWIGLMRDWHPWDLITIPDHEFADALQSIKYLLGQKIDILYMAACDMQQWEVQEEIKNSVSYTVADWQHTMGNIGWRFLNAIINNPSISAESLSISMARNYGHSKHFSSIKTSAIDQLTTRIDSLANFLIATPESIKARVIDHVILTMRSNDVNQKILDLGEFTNRLKSDSLMLTVKFCVEIRI